MVIRQVIPVTILFGCLVSMPALAEVYKYRHVIDAEITADDDTPPLRLLVPPSLTLSEITDGQSPGECENVRIEATGSGEVTSLVTAFSGEDAKVFERCPSSVAPCGDVLTSGSACNLGVRTVAQAKGFYQVDLETIASGGLFGSTQLAVSTSGFGGVIYGFGREGTGPHLGGVSKTHDLVEIDPSQPDFVKATNNAYNTYGLKEDGTIWGVGSTMGLNGHADSTKWVKVSQENDWIDVVAQFSSVIGVKSDGSTWVMGKTELPHPDTAEVIWPWTEIRNSNGIVSVKAYSSLALGIKDDGTLMVWGISDVYATDTASGENQWVELQPDYRVGHDFKQVASTYSTVFALDNFGQLYAYGGVYAGGDSSRGPEYTYEALPTWTNLGQPERWEKIATVPRRRIMYGIRTDGTLWVRGWDASAKVNYSEWTEISSSTDWAEIFGYAGGILALKTDGSLYARGPKDYYGTEDDLVTMTHLFEYPRLETLDIGYTSFVVIPQL
ncbi:hypothetical protein ACFOY8_14570 [Thalassospira xianhensis]|uniref:Uncharacterized protein n=1 Tax=Thalassospira xianhensis MCCC 1A02616 TaxID=1177929 RepID=A0A367UKH7_9PROT|nr:hypothetical protein [Thalassospira xianhensis]RCK07622.1 hypothetical protein TH5_00670 [Thalassospira xianhensis MCCC 1A02616]